MLVVWMAAEAGSGVPCVSPRPQVAPCLVLSLNVRPVRLAFKPWGTRLGFRSHSQNPSEGVMFKKKKIWRQGKDREAIYFTKSKFEMDLEGKLN